MPLLEIHVHHEVFQIAATDIVFQGQNWVLVLWKFIFNIVSSRNARGTGGHIHQPLFIQDKIDQLALWRQGQTFVDFDLVPFDPISIDKLIQSWQFFLVLEMDPLLLLVIPEFYFKHVNQLRLLVSHAYNDTVIEILFVLKLTLFVFDHHWCWFRNCEILFEHEVCVRDHLHFSEIDDKYFLSFWVDEEAQHIWDKNLECAISRLVCFFKHVEGSWNQPTTLTRIPGKSFFCEPCFAIPGI